MRLEQNSGIQPVERVPLDVISILFCTPEVVGVWF
jgi:hypothetical protein